MDKLSKFVKIWHSYSYKVEHFFTAYVIIRKTFMTYDVSQLWRRQAIK